MELTEFDIEFLTLKMSENPQSPLFARLADLYLTTGKATDAEHLCVEGVRNYPDYYAGHLVLGKVYLSFNEYAKARSSFQRAKQLSPLNKVISHYLNETPDKPDESTRVSDESYFVEGESPGVATALSSTTESETVPSPEGVSGTKEEPPIGESLFDLVEEGNAAAQTEEPMQSLFDMVSEESPIENTEETMLTLGETDTTTEEPQQDTEPAEDPFSQIIAQAQEEEEARQRDAEPSSFSDAFHSAMDEEESSIDLPQEIEEQSSVSYDTATEDYAATPDTSTDRAVSVEGFQNFDEFFSAHEDDPVTGDPITLDEYLDLPVGAAETSSVPHDDIEPEALVQESSEIAEEPVAETVVLEEENPLSKPLLQDTDDYFSNVPKEEEPEETIDSSGAEDDLDALAERLQNAERIVPQENYQSPEPITPKEEENAYDSDMVTPTLAEIYASQGEYGAAIQAYEILMLTQPDNMAKFQSRIEELQKLQSGG